jgi:hypothetical protein
MDHWTLHNGWRTAGVSEGVMSSSKLILEHKVPSEYVTFLGYKYKDSS